MAPKNLLAAAFCKGKLSSGSKPQPQRASDRKGNAGRFRPRPPALHRSNRGWAALAPWALLLCWGSPVPETHSPRVLLRGEAGLGARRPSAPRPEPCPVSQLGRSASRPRFTDGPKQSSGSCILQRETLLGQQTTAPTRLGSRKQCKPFSPPAPRSPYGESGLGCPGSLGPAALLGVSGARNPLPTGSPLWGSRIGRARAV